MKILAGLKQLSSWQRRRTGAFTLIEIMVVVGIMGIVLAMGIPSIVGAFRQEGIRKAMNDLVTACEKARAQAIISGAVTEVHIMPQEGTITVGQSSSTTSGGIDSGDMSGDEGGAVQESFTGFSAHLPGNVAFEMLDVNLVEYSQLEEARVRFFPNGSCDEMVAILVSDTGDRRVVTLEITTGLTTVLDDPRKLLR